jgi:hypothetical protein
MSTTSLAPKGMISMGFLRDLVLGMGRGLRPAVSAG